MAKLRRRNGQGLNSSMFTAPTNTISKISAAWSAPNSPMRAAGKAITLFKSYRKEYPDGGQQRDFIYVKDCVKVVLWLLDNPKVSGLFNVGTGKARSFDDLARALFAALGREPRYRIFRYAGNIARQIPVFHGRPAWQRLRDAGYTAAFFSLEDGIAIMCSII